MSPHIISSELVSSDIMAGRSGTMNVVPKVYNEVIDEVINNVNEIFADEGVDENGDARSHGDVMAVATSTLASSSTRTIART